MSDLSLYDIWRDENQEKYTYTWKRKLQPGLIQMGRLDFFLVSETLVNYSSDETICPGYRSDHSLISIALQFVSTQRANTFWKFNNSLLNNFDFIDEVKHVIKSVKQQYCATPYNLENINNIDNAIFETRINPQLFFDVLLLEIRGKSIAFSSALKKRDVNLINELCSTFKTLEETDPIKNFDLIMSKQAELQILREKKLRGTLVRARARWVDQAEKPSRYFCNLENRHFISKRMTSLISDNGNEVTDFNRINEEVLMFYKKLYSSREDDIENIDLDTRLNRDTPILSDEEAVAIEGPITIQEAAITLNNMQNNKSPGSTGFTTEFFKFFWKDLGVFLVNSLNYGFQKRELSATQKEGIIICIPKGNKSKKHIKNWRPISLLNISYKIASGAIAG